MGLRDLHGPNTLSLADRLAAPANSVLDSDYIRELIEQTHFDVNVIRKGKGLDPWDFSTTPTQQVARTVRKLASYSRPVGTGTQKDSSGHFIDATSCPAEIGRKLREKRLAEHLSLMKCAVRIGMGDMTLRAIEHGKEPRIRHATMVKICQWLGEPPPPSPVPKKPPQRERRAQR